MSEKKKGKRSNRWIEQLKEHPELFMYYNRATLTIQIQELILELALKKGISQDELHTHLDMDKEELDAIFSDEAPMTLEFLADVGLLLDVQFEVTHKPIVRPEEMEAIKDET